VSEDVIFLWLGGLVVLIFFGYAALVGSIERVVGWKKVDKEIKNLQTEMREFAAAREAAQQEFNQNGQCYFSDVKKVS
jgi:uncharacterized membrane protein (DUF106 family)